MAFKLDMSKFKKVAAHKDHTIMRDERGNEIKVAHSALSPKLRGMLHELPVYMADGGQVPENTQDPAQPGQQAPVVVNVNQAPTAERAPAGNAQEAYMATMAAQNPPVQGPPTPMPVPADAIGAAYATAANQAAAKPSSPAAPQQEAPQNAQTPSAGLLSQAPAPQSQAPSLGVNTQLPPSSGGGLDIMSAYNTGRQGINEQAKAEAAQHAEQAAILQNSVKNQQQFQATFQQQSQDHDKEILATMQDVRDGHIDPNRLWAAKSTPAKIATSIGIILGGIGGGLTGQENPALKFLNQQIDRDVDAQRMDMNKRQNLLAANFDRFKNFRDAADMTRLMQASIISSQIAQAAEKAGSPLAQARAKQAISELQAKYYPLKIDLDMRRAVSNFTSQGAGEPGSNRIEGMLNYLRVVAPERAKEMQERYVPGINGLAAIPVPQAGREAIMAKQNLNVALKSLAEWSVKHQGSMNPADVNYGKTKAAEIQSLYRNAINGGVFKKGEQEFIDNIIDSDPTKFFNSLRVAPKLKAVLETNMQQLNNLKQSYGLPQDAPPAQYAKMNGVTYVKVPGGWKKAQ